MSNYLDGKGEVRQIYLHIYLAPGTAKVEYFGLTPSPSPSTPYVPGAYFEEGFQKYNPATLPLKTECFIFTPHPKTLNTRFWGLEMT